MAAILFWPLDDLDSSKLSYQCIQISKKLGIIWDSKVIMSRHKNSRWPAPPILFWPLDDIEL